MSETVLIISFSSRQTFSKMTLIRCGIDCVITLAGYYLTALGTTNTVLGVKLLLAKSLRPFQVNNVLLINEHPQHKVQ